MVAVWRSRSVFLIALCLCFFPLQALAEYIPTFSATYTINTDGSVLVVEEISYDFGAAQKHGIFRDFETDHPQPASNWLKTREVDVAISGVMRDGVAEPYTVSRQGGEIRMKIGDANVVHTGAQRYTIIYTLRGALSYGTNGAELYWNATGHRWPAEIGEATVRVVGPSGVLLSQQTCYEGVVGSTDRCLVAQDLVAPNVVIFSASRLASGEGMTIAQAVDAAQVQELVIETWPIQWLLILFAASTVLLVTLFSYRRQTFYKPQQPIIAQYEPYPGLLPMYTGTVFDGSFDSADLVAGIVYLAEQGFIKIKRTETKVLSFFTTHDYELTLLRPVTEASDQALQTVLELIFTIPEKAESGTIAARLSYLVGTAGPSEARVGEVVTLSELRQFARKNYEVFQKLRTAFRESLVVNGFYEESLLALGKQSVPALIKKALIMLGLVLAVTVASGSGLLAILLIVLGVLAVRFIFSRRRTRKGYEARFHLLGFKKFLSVTDQERFAFHNAPEKSPELFMAYLPYAIALGVEKQWAKAFEGIAMQNPDWYEGGGLHTFSATAFAADLSTFATSFNTSSGTSGSSGGGSSGGGGGGGGGGSW